MNEINVISKTVEDLVIKDQDSFELTGTYLVSCARFEKEVNEYFEEVIGAANQTHKLLTAKRKHELSLISEVKELIKQKRRVYKTEQDRIADEARRKAEQAERDRVKAEQDKLLEQAAKTEDPEVQEMLIEKAEEIVATPVFVEKEVKKTTGYAGGGSTTFVSTLEVEVTDKKLLCEAIGAGIVPVSVVEFKQGALKTWVKAMDIKPNQIKGLTIIAGSSERVKTK